jgi:RNA polymerase sigma factor (sigma-70 family)
VTLTPAAAAAYVAGAAAGDRRAWESLVDAYGGLIWTIVRNHRLRHGDAADVSQTTWLRLVENIHRLTDPGRVGAWLATTARRECLRFQAKARRLVPVAGQLDPAADPLFSADPGPEAGLLAAERDAEVRDAVRLLPPREQQLIRMFMLDPAPTYDEISAALGIPVGSIGPTRRRCLEKLKGLGPAGGIAAAHARSS